MRKRVNNHIEMRRNNFLCNKPNSDNSARSLNLLTDFSILSNIFELLIFIVYLNSKC